MQKHNDDTIKTSGHSSLKKYTSHFIWKGSKGLLKVLLCERWVGDWRELQHIDPLSYGHNSVSFPFSWAAQPGAWGPSLCWDMSLVPVSSLQLIWTSCRRGYIIIWRPPTSCERHNFELKSTPRQSRSPLISWYLRPDAPVIYTSAFLLLAAWSGRRSICNHPNTENLRMLGLQQQTDWETQTRKDGGQDTETRGDRYMSKDRHGPAWQARVFANGPGDEEFNPRWSHSKDLKNGSWYLLA